MHIYIYFLHTSKNSDNSNAKLYSSKRKVFYNLFEVYVLSFLLCYCLCLKVYLFKTLFFGTKKKIGTKLNWISNKKNHSKTIKIKRKYFCLSYLNWVNIIYSVIIMVLWQFLQITLLSWQEILKIIIIQAIFSKCH